MLLFVLVSSLPFLSLVLPTLSGSVRQLLCFGILLSSKQTHHFFVFSLLLLSPPSVSSFSLLLLPRLGLWSRDKAAKGKAVAAIGAVGQIDATATEVEVVGGVSVRASSRRPVIAVLASAVKGDFSVWGYVLTAEIDKPAPHKEEGILWG